ncbi:MAG TPA: DUF4405 domain-containing protein, partial [Thermoanaerobaculia bacterium]|nr:DUF4405 domain-containing protein [Thermoanaerobaculia bacterium]
MRSRFWVVLDCSMLLSFVVLQSWRLTGVVVHEWLSVALIAGLLAHLVLHWSWVATRSKRVLAPRSTRTRVNYALNLTLFVAATVAMVSGFMISKVVLPLNPMPVNYLKWHQLHSISATTSLICLGLHLALNWNLMVAALRNSLRRRPTRVWSLRLKPLFAPLAIITASVIILSAALLTVERIMPACDVTIIQRDGRRIEHAPPPADIARLLPDEIPPSTRGIPKFILMG